MMVTSQGDRNGDGESLDRLRLKGLAPDLERDASRRDADPRGGPSGGTDAGPSAHRTPIILDRVAAGDRSSYEILFHRYREPLTRFIRSHVDRGFLSQVSEEDLFQEVQLEAIRGLASFTYGREMSFFFWLCGIARNVIHGHCRRMRRRPPPIGGGLKVQAGSGSSVELLAAVRDDAPSPEDQAVLRNNLHLLAIALQGLSSKRREALLLRYVEGHDNKDVASILGVSQKASSNLVVRGLEQLHEALVLLMGENRPPRP